MFQHRQYFKRTEKDPAQILKKIETCVYLFEINYNLAQKNGAHLLTVHTITLNQTQLHHLHRQNNRSLVNFLLFLNSVICTNKNIS